MPRYSDLQTDLAAFDSIILAAQTAKAALVEIPAADALRRILEKAMEPQPITFPLVLRAIAGFDFSAAFAGFLASPAGAFIEPGTAANLTALSLQLDPMRQLCANLAQAFDDAVGQVMAANQGPPGEEGEGGH